MIMLGYTHGMCTRVLLSISAGSGSQIYSDQLNTACLRDACVLPL